MLKKIISTLLVISMLVGVTVLGTAAANSSPFPDVKTDDWFYTYTMAVYNNGLMKGDTSGCFYPNNNMTRAELVTILSRLAKVDVTGYASQLTFADTVGHWSADNVGWAVSQGLVKGFDANTFGPEANISRQDLATLLDRFVKKYEVKLRENPLVDSFPDKNSFADYAAEPIENMRRYGIICGDTAGNFNAESPATRAEIAVMLSRYIDGSRDIMFKKFENIDTILAAGGSKIEFNFGPTESSLPNDEDLTIPYFTFNNLKTAILERLDLSSDTYEIIMDAEQFEGALLTYRNLEYGKSSMSMLHVGIKNKISGEETATKRIRLNFNKVEEIVFVDPDNFDPKIDADFYNSMMEASLYSTGNIARLAAALNKAEKGEDITVGYIGGSITEGASATWQKCWARISANWLVKHYPESEITYVNAGISGTPSSFGNMRLNRDLLSHNPDIVFIEFAVNDSATPIQRESFESMVRTTLSQENDPAVVVVLSYSGYGEFDEDSVYMKELAALYGLPVVDVDKAVAMGIEAGYYTREEYIPDGVHPHYYGHQLMSDMIENLFKNVVEMAKTASDEELTVNPMIEETYQEHVNLTDLTFVSPDNFTVDSMGTWEIKTKERLHGYDTSWYTNSTANAEALEFTFTGSSLVFALAGENADEYCGYLEVTVDGVTSHIGAEPAYFTSVHQVYVPGGSGEHHVSVKLVNWDTATHILGFAYGE